MLSHAYGKHPWVTVLVLIALIVASEGIPVRGSRALKRVFTESVVLEEGELIPFHPINDVSDGDSFEDGMRAVGEWIQSMGLFGDEKEPTAPPAPKDEPFELDIGHRATDANLYRTLTRAEFASGAAVAEPSTSSAPRPCSSRGVLMNKTSLVNKCSGYQCEIQSMVCEGSLYDGSTLYSYQGSMANCKVTSLNCPNKPGPLHVFDESCPIQKFECPTRGTKKPSELNGQSFAGCDVQVYCPTNNGSNNHIYGWEAWDFQCTTSELVCDGKVIDSPNRYQAQNGSCFIRYLPCGEKTSPSASTCNRIDGLCNNDPTDNLCLLTSIRGQKTCDPTLPRQYATIGQITCPDGTHDYATWNGSISTCTSVRSVKFDGTTYDLPYNETRRSFCVLSQLDCGGFRVPWNFTERIPEGCGVARVVCGEPPALTLPPTTYIPMCTSYSYGCATPSSTCIYTEASAPCSTTCNQPGLAETCDCPVDFTGPLCATPRPITCRFNVSDSIILHESSSQQEAYKWESNCKSLLKPMQLGEPVCHPILSTDILTITGRLNCSFSDSSLDSILRNTVTDFNYTLLAENFRLSNSSSTQSWSLSMKAFNYAAFTDNDAAITPTLTSSQMAGNNTITFLFDPRRIGDKYKSGGRVRLEWVFLADGASPQSMYNKVMYGATVDLMDWKEAYPSKSSRFSGRILTIVLLSIFGVFIAGLFVWRYISKRKSNARHL